MKATYNINHLIHTLRCVPPITGKSVKQLTQLTDAEYHELYSLMGKKGIIIPTLQHNKLALEYLRSDISNHPAPGEPIFKSPTTYPNKIPTNVLPTIMKLACITIGNQDELSEEPDIVYNFKQYQEYLKYINKLVGIGVIKVFKYDNGYSEESFERMVHKVHKDGSSNYVIMDEFINNYILNEEITNVDKMVKNILDDDFYQDYPTYVRYRIIDGYLKKFGSIPTFIGLHDFIEICIPGGTNNNHRANRHFKKIDFVNKYLKTRKIKLLPDKLFLKLVNYGEKGNPFIFKKQNVGYNKFKSGLLNIKPYFKLIVNHVLDEVKKNRDGKKLNNCTPIDEGKENKNPVDGNKETIYNIPQLIHKINNIRSKRALNQLQLPDLIVNKNNGTSVINLLSHASIEPNSEIKEQYLLTVLKRAISRQVFGMEYGCSGNGTNKPTNGTIQNKLDYLNKYSLTGIGDLIDTSLTELYDKFFKNPQFYTLVFNEDSTKALVLYRNNVKSKDIHRYQYHIEMVVKIDPVTKTVSGIKLNRKIPLFLDFTDTIKFNKKTISLIIEVVYNKYCNMLKIAEVLTPDNSEIIDLLVNSENFEDMETNLNEFRNLLK